MRKATLTLLLASAVVGCGRRGLPKPGSSEYAELVRVFNVGLAGLQSGEDVRAKSGLTRATEIGPGEPASWANLGILAVRQQELDAAWQHMEKARTLAPENSRIEQFLGDIESRRGKLPEAVQHFKKAVDLDRTNLKARYALAEQTERGGSSEAEALAQLKQLLELQPANSAVLLDAIRLAARVGDGNAVHSAIARLRQNSASWSAEGKQRLDSLQKVAGGNLRGAAIEAAMLRNVLLREPGYRQDMNAVKTPAVFAGEPFVRFLRLASPGPEPAEPDMGVTFTRQTPAGPSGDGVRWIRAMYLDDSGAASLAWADDKGIFLSSGARLAIPAGSDLAVAAADLNYDFKTDLVVTTAAGLRIYRQDESQQFRDVTALARLPKDVISTAYSGAWPFDVDLDGDLDVFLGLRGSDPVVLRNNGDDSFAIVRPFSSAPGIALFAAADLDGDGDPDVALVDGSGRLQVWANERLGQYSRRTIPSAIAGNLLDVSAADVNNDGQMDLLVLKSDGTVVRLSDKDDGQSWETADVITGQTGARTLLTADLDNNGALDLLAGSSPFTGGARGFSPLKPFPAITSPSVADLTGDGRLDIVGLAGGTPVLLVNRGSKAYRWQVIRTRAANARGDQRINSFGIGGEMEVRAGLLTEKQIINAPVLHFGLGEHSQSDLARIIWPNGLTQVEFELKANQSVLAAQRLKGSCPSLFAWDGSTMSFVKDGAPWSPALGLHINAQQVAGIYQTQEWFKIPGNQIAPRDGYYDLRVTAELWETYYIDHYSLLMVDHPAGTEIYTDERFSLPPPALKIYTTEASKPFVKATDDTGRDVREAVRATDKIYLDTFGRGQYQGVTRDHFVELALPPEAPRSGPLYLIGDGWMHPTDATVNIALGQTSNPPPQGLRIDVPDASGRWITAQTGLGFPAGKLKTIVLDISKVFRPGAPRTLRLGTNMEVYWDRLAWAAGLPSDRVTTQKLPLSHAELRYRGFSMMRAANTSSPEVPDYDRIEGTGQKWRDLQGYYTRYGDIRPLLEKIDDRIVIVNAGDEMRFRFAAAAPPVQGRVRDFIMVGDGWIKDGDYNSVYSKTVTPLPYHGLQDYTSAPLRLEDNIAYRRHSRDWELFHTRYVAPDFFRGSLWTRH